MTTGNRFHSRVMVRIAHVLEGWLERQPEPRGEILCGEAGVRLKRDPDTTVGIDVVYVAADVATAQTDDTTIVDGVPVLVVEILSPYDTQDEIHEKIDAYLGAGVPLVWIVEPRRAPSPSIARTRSRSSLTPPRSCPRTRTCRASACRPCGCSADGVRLPDGTYPAVETDTNPTCKRGPALACASGQCPSDPRRV